MRYITFFIILNLCVTNACSMDAKRKKKDHSKLRKKSTTAQSSKHKEKNSILRPKFMCGPYIDAGGKVDCECVLY